MKIHIVTPKVNIRTSEYKFAPPMPLKIIASLIPPQHEVKIIDESIRNEVINYDEPVDLVFITSYTFNVLGGYNIADNYRKRGAKVVMGGLHVRFMVDEALQHADAVAVGEAENTVPEILRDFENGTLKQRYVPTEKCDLTKIPVITEKERSLLKLDQYTIPNTFQASRGCPYSCEFCAVTAAYGASYRFRKLEDVVKEVSISLKNATGVQRILFFVDDHITARKSYFLKLFKEMKKLGHFMWSCQMTLKNAADDEILQILSETNCTNVFIGFESLSENLLKGMGKGHNKVEEYEAIIKKVHSYGIPINGSFVFGLDGDDEGVFERTFDFAQKTGIDMGTFNAMTPFPGTKLRERLERDGRILSNDWSKYDCSNVVYEPIGMSPKTIEDGIHWLWTEYYSKENMEKRQKVSPKTMGILNKHFYNY
ncbi:DNA phosphorothioation-dependent restriction protein DptG [Anaerobacterium chartisolvens]|uniref:DNA phosphorothioation-dependent restriction protein DptG n=1 Tax=Anaerobacterium chartisolvens TaxID=1297424 RepID=A0A369B9Z6_9FIRM|nr:radical SAM protein [Anaerobacterium chartisolvens]RCX18359.1 DNA phosphorothioation-dependent restriction protein DptG [Anaerobacterium chartisolvens]